ncbi:amino acid permease, partial [Salmonella enterica subsp. enterica serovar Anatum]|nr:amino acid permease [Salmonella enterica subsp. enterica serovar Anatum]
FIDRWTVLFGLAIVVGPGLIYMFLTRPFGRSAAPENDAIAYASKLNMGQDN